MGTTLTPAVMFLCTHNAGRSQIAAGWLTHLSGGQVEVFSAGSEPGPNINPVAVDVMREVGIDIRANRPKSWTDSMVRRADVIVSMGCGDVCPIYPGKSYLDWDVADPHGSTIENGRSIRDDIESRVRELLFTLGVSLRGASQR